MGVFIFPFMRKEVMIRMLFTEGKHRKYERMMREKPRAPGRSKSEAMLFKERDCPHCLYYSNKEGKCGLEKCVVFE